MKKKNLRFARSVSSEAGVAAFHGLRAGRYRVVLGHVFGGLTLLAGSLETAALDEECETHWRPARAAIMVDLDGIRLASIDFRVVRKGEIQLDLGERDSSVVAVLRRRDAAKHEADALSRICGIRSDFVPETPSSRRSTRQTCAMGDADLRFPGIAPGVYELVFRMPSASTRCVPEPRRVIVNPGQTTRVRVPFAPARALVDGQLLIDGKPASNCRVALVEGTRVLKTGDCDLAGRFAFAGLRPGRYRLRWTRVVRSPGKRAREELGSVELTAPGRGLVLRLDAQDRSRRGGR